MKIFLLSILSFGFVTATAQAKSGLVIDGIYTSRNLKDKKVVDRYRQIQKFASGKMRTETFEKKKKKSLMIYTDKDMIFCDLQNQAKECHNFASQDGDKEDQNSPKIDTSNPTESLKELKENGTGINIKKWKVTKLKKTGKYAGYSCQFYKRSYIIEVDMGSVKTVSRSNETLCIEQKKIKHPFMSSYDGEEASELVKDPMFKKIIAEEAKAVGTLLYSSSRLKVKVNMNMGTSTDQEEDNSIGGGLFAGVVGEMKLAAKKAASVATSTKTVFKARKVKQTSPRKSWWSVPKGFKVKK